MSEMRYSVGELAAMTHLTIRTLQHYDSIGLLPASRHPESGRRLYSDDDIIRLEQILFYKSLGFSLDEIKANLIESNNLAQVRESFVKQQYLLLRKIEQLHTSFAALDASLQVMDIGYPPPFAVILRFIHLLPGDDVFEWGPSLIDADQQPTLSEIFETLEEAQSFYHTLKGLLIHALVLFHARVPPSHPQAQSLARKWLGLLQAISAGNPKGLEEVAQIGRSPKFGISQNQERMAEVYEYIEIAVEYHHSNPPA